LVLAALTAGAARAGEIAGTVRGRDGHPLRDAVVFVVGVQAGTPPRRAVVMDQRKRTFIPHVMVVQLGTTIEFPNNDTVYHNVFSFREGKRFDLGLYPVGTTRREVMSKPGLVRLFCNIHSNMSAFIWVVENPYFCQTGEDGAFRLEGVPTGSYTVRFWHAKEGSTTHQLEVRAGATREDVTLDGS
jgi:plastocyanin